ncbi:MAG: rane protein [Pseudonocardiales bacterium]|nr:rane protein [Pseudonocardiales bacterium]
MTTSFATTPRLSLALDYPTSLGTYANYADAQRIVDHLSDRDFPVQNVSIIGTGLHSVERVTGRLTRGKLAAAGALSGLWMGIFVGIAFALFSRQGQLGFLLTTPLLGAAFGLIWSQLGFRAATRHGARDFASISRVMATTYEVLVEHRSAERAHELLADMPHRTAA